MFVFNSRPKPWKVTVGSSGLVQAASEMPPPRPGLCKALRGEWLGPLPNSGDVSLPALSSPVAEPPAATELRGPNRWPWQAVSRAEENLNSFLGLNQDCAQPVYPHSNPEASVLAREPRQPPRCCRARTATGHRSMTRGRRVARLLPSSWAFRSPDQL